MTRGSPGKRLLLAAAVIGLALAGCAEDVSVRVAPGSTAGHLTFRVSTRHGGKAPAAPRGVFVTPCRPRTRDSATIWGIGRNLEATNSITEITYGRVPPGYTEISPPKPLVPGCYAVSYAAKEATYFLVADDGRVVEISADVVHGRPGGIRQESETSSEDWRPEREGAMSDDRAALEALLSVSSAGALHVVLHYLYFPEEDAAAAAAAELRSLRFETEERLGAYGTDWLVLARHEIVPSEETIAAARRTMEGVARRHRGEYDGWEAEVQR